METVSVCREARLIVREGRNETRVARCFADQLLGASRDGGERAQTGTWLQALQSAVQ